MSLGININVTLPGDQEMSGFQNFIVQEDLRAEYAQRFLTFQERYHHEVFVDLKKTLEQEWSKETSALSKKFKIKQDDLEFALLQNPNATVKLSVENKSEKIMSTRHRNAINAVLSVKIPLILSNEERDFIIKSLASVTEAAFKSVTHRWSEIFKIETKTRSKPCFRITKDEHDEVRLQFALSAESAETYRTLYATRVEYGKASSKLKDFDRFYLVSLL